MVDVYLNAVLGHRASRVEPNDSSSLGHNTQEIERIVGKTGVHQRPVVADGEYTTHLATAATHALLQREACPATDIDTLLVCTQTPDHLIPGVSSKLHGNLGLPMHCAAVDLNQGCSGFVYGLQLAAALLRSGASRKTLLVNADCYSRLIRSDDLATRILFGDAAAASLLSTESGGLRLDYVRCYSDGRGYDAFVAHNSALLRDDTQPRGIQMDGPGILNFALRVVPDAVQRALTDCGLRREDIRCFAFHQANSFVIGKLVQKLRLDPAQAPDNCADLGNTVSASIPFLLHQQMNSFRPGDKILAVGFGVGLSWGAALLEYRPVHSS